MHECFLKKYLRIYEEASSECVKLLLKLKCKLTFLLKFITLIVSEKVHKEESLYDYYNLVLILQNRTLTEV